MSDIKKKPISSLGYNFVAKEFIPKGKDEYYLRNIQNRSGIAYRQLTKAEIKSLQLNNNTADDWFFLDITHVTGAVNDFWL